MAIGLPKDASGAIVPFDTTMMYRENGNQFHVSDLFFEARPRRWFARSGSECIETNKLYLDASEKDSWEKLEEDLGRAVERDVVPTGCRYFNATNKCNGCPLYGGVNCDVHRDERAFENILDRIRKLRGEDE